MTLELRPYQANIIEETRAKMLSGSKSIAICSPTGSGKTILVAHMLKTAAQKGVRSIFLVHRRELINQSILAFGEIGLNHGVIANGFWQDSRHQIQIGSVQTIARKLKKIQPPKLIVFDECHHIAAKSWASIYQEFPNSFFIGCSATMERLDGTGLGKWFQEMIHGPSVQWLIEKGFLCPYKLYAPSSVNLAGIHTRMGDFQKDQLSAAVDKPTITGDAIKHYQKLGNGNRAVVFCCSIEHSKHVVSQFLASGISAAHVDGDTEVNERDNSIRRFMHGEIKVLSNVDIFGEGFDLPSLEVAILLRPTKSLGLYLQQVGRALRPFPGKKAATILDHAGNCQRHGLPDEERFWSLEGSRGKKGKKEVSESVKICPRCFAAQFSGKSQCGTCGYVFEVNSRKINEKDGELVEIDSEKLRRIRLKEQSRANTEDELVELGISRGYKRPRLWARHVIRARQGRKFLPVET